MKRDIWLLETAGILVGRGTYLAPANLASGSRDSWLDIEDRGKLWIVENVDFLGFSFSFPDSHSQAVTGDKWSPTFD